MIQRPLVAITLVVGVQAVVLAAGWLAVYNATYERIAAGVSDIIIDNNRLVAHSLSERIGTLPTEFNPDSEAWERAQSAVSAVDFGAGGFACILGADGHIVCHPQIDNPMVRGADMSAMPVSPDGPNQSDIPLLTFGLSGADAGIVDMGPAGRHYIATKVVSPDGAKLLVHQPVSGISSAVETVTAGLLARMIAAGIIITAISAAAIAWLMKRHTRAMARWNKQLESKVQDRTRQVRRSREAIVLALAKITEYRDNETGLHVERIGEYSRVLARQLAKTNPDLTPEWIDRLRLAATLHDIGKVAVPDAVLRKPGKLNDAEFNEIKRHPSVGADTLIAVHRELDSDPLVAMAVEICLYHHERWDGSGYPVGLAREDIPLAARIVAVVDVFDALLSPRCYKPAFDREKTESIIRESAGTHFDPQIVEAFLACLPELFQVRAEREDIAAPTQAPPNANAA